MEAEAQTGNSFVPKRKNKLIFLSAITICVILVIGAVVYFFVRNATHNDTVNSDSSNEKFEWHHNEEIKLLQKYLRFPTISLISDFGPCVEFLKSLGHELKLNVSVLYPVNKQNPVILMTWQGEESNLPSILLNSHMDVVPVAEEYWSHPPFSAHIDENGNIFARGTQDMKSIGMLYLAAIRALKRKGIERLKRTVHLTYVPDEETNGEFGMGSLVNSEIFKDLNVGCALDEGYPSATQDLEVFYTEKPMWEVLITAHGHSGHASVLFNDTAVEKLNYVMNKFLNLRRTETWKLTELNYPYGNVTAINLTVLKGGFKSNVVPPEMSVLIDMRLAIDSNDDEIESMISRWAEEAGPNVTVHIDKSIPPNPTSFDSSNPYWIAFKNATSQLRMHVKPGVFRAATDSRYLRNLNIPAFGFSPMFNTPPKLHEHNEFINIDTYLKGIEIYEKIIKAMANLN